MLLFLPCDVAAEKVGVLCVSSRILSGRLRNLVCNTPPLCNLPAMPPGKLRDSSWQAGEYCLSFRSHHCQEEAAAVCGMATKQSQQKMMAREKAKLGLHVKKKQTTKTAM